MTWMIIILFIIFNIQATLSQDAATGSTGSSNAESPAASSSTSIPDPCTNANSLSDHATPGTCIESELARGTSCKPECGEGYTGKGEVTCPEDTTKTLINTYECTLLKVGCNDADKNFELNVLGSCKCVAYV